LICFCPSPLLPPNSTFFPYTTLFRSFLHTRVVHIKRFAVLLDPGVQTLVADTQLTRRLADVATGFSFRHRLTLVAFADASGNVRDRKSTRLNSSHVKISYAVFCLKKK